jgi:hypothetical protein
MLGVDLGARSSEQRLFEGTAKSGGIMNRAEIGSAYGTRTRDLCLERANQAFWTGLAQVARGSTSLSISAVTVIYGCAQLSRGLYSLVRQTVTTALPLVHV